MKNVIRDKRIARVGMIVIWIFIAWLIVNAYQHRSDVKEIDPGERGTHW